MTTRRTRRNLLTIAAIATWAAMAAELVRRHSSGSAVPLLPVEEIAAIAGGPETRDEWFAVRQGGRKVGWSHRAVERDADGIALREDSSFVLAMLGVPQTLRTSIRAHAAADGALRDFEFRLISPATRFRATGRVDGASLRVRYGAEGTEEALDVPLREPIHLPSTVRPRVVSGRPAAGTRFSIDVFSPLSLRNEPLTIIVEGRETIPGPDGPVETTRITEEQGGARARSWLADDGSSIREEGTLGFTMERIAARDATVGIERDAPPDLALGSGIPCTGTIRDPRHARRLVLRVGGAAAARVPDDPPRQRIRGDRLEIALEGLPTGLPAGLPVAGAPDDAAPLLDPSPFIESDDPAIVGTARSIVAGEGDPVRAARRIVDWVGANLDKQPALTVPSAREVLRSRRGDCNEHAVLVAALARAAGIPARVVAGAVWAEDGFLYHAWVEFWLGRWTSADAVFGQMPADATHVKLLDGGPEKHVALAPIIGGLSFAVLEEEP